MGMLGEMGFKVSRVKGPMCARAWGVSSVGIRGYVKRKIGEVGWIIQDQAGRGA